MLPHSARSEWLNAALFKEQWPVKIGTKGGITVKIKENSSSVSRLVQYVGVEVSLVRFADASK